MTPSNNANGPDRPLTVAVGLDSQAPVIHQPMPDGPPGAQPAAWSGVDGFSANAIIPVGTLFRNVTPGKHTLKVLSLIVFNPCDTDQSLLDCDDRASRSYPEDPNW